MNNTTDTDPSVETRIEHRPFEEQKAVSPLMGDISAISRLTPELLASKSGAYDLAEELLREEVFHSRTEAQEFTAILMQRARNEPLAPGMTEYLDATIQLIAQTAVVAAARGQALANQSKLDRARMLAVRASKRLEDFRDKLHSLRESLGGDWMPIETAFLPSAPISMLVDFGARLAGAERAMLWGERIVIPKMEKELQGFVAEVESLLAESARAHPSSAR